MCGVIPGLFTSVSLIMGDLVQHLLSQVLREVPVQDIIADATATGDPCTGLRRC